jgi:iron complex transport system ATP-binding protein
MVEKQYAKFEIVHANLGYANHCVLSDISLTLQPNSITCLLGANGVGKTTLFRSMLGTLPVLSGKILLNGKPVSKYSTREFARYVAYVPQAHNSPYPYSVLDVVLFGRAAHLGYFERPGKEDRIIAESYLDLLGISHLKDKSFMELSGGERQMVIIARVLTQETPFLIFDEPTSSLDYGNQIRVIEKIRLLKKRSIGILMATHSPDHAFILGSNVIILEHGCLFQNGIPDAILTSEVLKQTYGVDVRIINTPKGPTPSRKICIPEFYSI